MPVPTVDEIAPPLPAVVLTLPPVEAYTPMTLRTADGVPFATTAGQARVAAELGARGGAPALRVVVRRGGIWAAGSADPARETLLVTRGPVDLGGLYLTTGARLRVVAVSDPVAVLPEDVGGLKPGAPSYPVPPTALQLAPRRGDVTLQTFARAAGATDELLALRGPLRLRDAPGGAVVATAPRNDEGWPVWVIAREDQGVRVAVAETSGAVWRGVITAREAADVVVDGAIGSLTGYGRGTGRGRPAPLACDAPLPLSVRVGGNTWVVGGLDAGTPFWVVPDGTYDLPDSPLELVEGATWSLPEHADRCPAAP